MRGATASRLTLELLLDFVVAVAGRNALMGVGSSAVHGPLTSATTLSLLNLFVAKTLLLVCGWGVLSAQLEIPTRRCGCRFSLAFSGNETHTAANMLSMQCKQSATTESRSLSIHLRTDAQGRSTSSGSSVYTVDKLKHFAACQCRWPSQRMTRPGWTICVCTPSFWNGSASRKQTHQRLARYASRWRGRLEHVDSLVCR